MEITEAQYQLIAPILPVQRGNVSLPNLQVLNAILYVAEQGCKWRGLPPRFGNWHTVYMRMNRWSGARPGIRISATRADSAHQARGGFDGQHHRQGPSRWYGCVKKNGPQAIGKSRGGWTTKIHMVAADARTAVTFSLSPGQAHDAPEGRKLLTRLGSQGQKPFLIMDRAYEGNETRQLALALGFTFRPGRATPGDVQEADEIERARSSMTPVHPVCPHPPREQALVARTPSMMHEVHESDPGEPYGPGHAAAATP